MKKVIAALLCSSVVFALLVPHSVVFAEEDDSEMETVELDLSDLEEMGPDYVEESKYSLIVTTSGGNLNVRDWPITGNIIATLPNGTIVDTPYKTKDKAHVDGWIWIDVPVEGYVCMDYLKYPGGR
ncbi:hypothetical protein SAMN02910275_00674 [Butyrivibrio sp. INlla18]|uniref:hypothetical protein n=1 Tax=Butyrivibrio sp. INlla18 TaxID=1520806 RepID=UPI0008879E49|nr:hypothetical protein [Butyrivibrio sp. INlla18]SDA47565.1 hypothetical protein SAMN02910275_00674 [Butyrivibrio sp. INlla18]